MPYIRAQLSLEKYAYQEFKNAWYKNKFQGQRYGQAFYNHFKLHKLANQEQLQGLYEKDGDEARHLIGRIFRFI